MVEKEEAQRLKEYLNTHNSLVGILLSELVLERMDAGFVRLELSGNRIEEIMENTQGSVMRIEQAVMCIPRLIYALARDANASCRKITQMLSRVW